MCVYKYIYTYTHIFKVKKVESLEKISEEVRMAVTTIDATRSGQPKSLNAMDERLSINLIFYIISLDDGSSSY